MIAIERASPADAPALKRLLEAVQPSGPGGFVVAAEALWKAMDQGALFGYHKLLRFNGHFFHSAEALPLEADELALQQAMFDFHPSMAARLTQAGRSLKARLRYRVQQWRAGRVPDPA